MASMYAKLMGRITESSLMEEPIIVRYCFMMLLAVADPQGYAIGTDVALARRLNMPLDEFRECIVDLMRPDPHSNSKEHEGRRIIESDGERGYWIVNYVKYRDTRDEEQRREYMRVYMQNHRAKKAGVKAVKPSKQRKLSLAKGEVEVEAETLSPGVLPTIEQVRAGGLKAGIPPNVSEQFFHRCEARPLSPAGLWTDKNGTPIAKWLSALTAFGRSFQSIEQSKHGNSRTHQPGASRANAASLRDTAHEYGEG